MTVTKAAHTVMTDVYWEPYAVWWVENKSGKLVRLLFITYYDDNTQNVRDVGCGKMGYLYSLNYFWSRFGTSGCPSTDEQCRTCPACPHDYALPDGVTGCSEHNDVYAPVVISRTWDMVDRTGAPVPAGTYSFCYSSVYADEEFGDTFDKAFKVSVTLGTQPLDTVVNMPADIAGTSTDQELIVHSIRIQYGGSDSTAGPPPPSSLDPRDHPANVAPPAATAEPPPQDDFCGSGSAAAAAVALLAMRMARLRNRKCWWIALVALALVLGMFSALPAAVVEEEFSLDDLETPATHDGTAPAVEVGLHQTPAALLPAAALLALVLLQAGSAVPAAPARRNRTGTTEAEHET
jgi:hypothetical protein